MTTLLNDGRYGDVRILSPEGIAELERRLDENKAVQAYFKGHKQLVICDDVDIGLMIEQKIGDKPALMGYTVRRANHKTYPEIHQEIRSVQSGPAPPSRGMPAWLQKAFLLPPPLSGWFGAVLDLAMRRDPTIFTSLAGTVGITAVGMFGKGQGGWGVAPLTHGLNLIVGGIAWKPANAAVPITDVGGQDVAGQRSCAGLSARLHAIIRRSSRAE